MPDRVQPTGLPETLDAVTEIDEQSALKPLLYILVLPFLFIALLQWSGLPSALVDLIGG